MSSVETHPIPVYASRFTPYLKPGDGAKIDWEIGEVVVACCGINFNGRRFVVTSKRMTHRAAPGEFVREGYWEDEPGDRTAKLPMFERRLWFPGEGREPVMAEGW